MNHHLNLFFTMLPGMLLTCLAGCIKTEMHSFVDPEFQGHRYERLVISVETEALDQRDCAEAVFSKTLSKQGLTCVRAIDLCPPTRETDEQQFQQAVAQSGADGVLTVRLTQFYEDEFYVPPSSSTYTTGSVSSNTYYHRHRATTYGTVSSSSHTTTSGGYIYTKPRMRHEVKLWDVKTGKMAWVGGALTEGQSESEYEPMMTSLAKKTTETLRKEGLLLHPPHD